PQITVKPARRVPGAAQHEVMRCRPETVPVCDGPGSAVHRSAPMALPRGPASGTREKTSLPRAIRLAARVHPGEGPVETLDLVDQHQRLVIGAAPALRGDDEIGLVGIGFHDPWPSQQRLNPVLPRTDANEDAGRGLG